LCRAIGAQLRDCLLPRPHGRGYYLPPLRGSALEPYHACRKRAEGPAKNRPDRKRLSNGCPIQRKPEMGASARISQNWYRAGFQPLIHCFDSFLGRCPRLILSGLSALWSCGPAQFERQRRDAIPAWGEAPGETAKEIRAEGPLQKNFLDSFSVLPASTKQWLRMRPIMKVSGATAARNPKTLPEGTRRSQEFQPLDSLVRSG
jgi:hypothetical protein